MLPVKKLSTHITSPSSSLIVSRASGQFVDEGVTPETGLRAITRRTTAIAGRVLKSGRARSLKPGIAKDFKPGITKSLKPGIPKPFIPIGLPERHLATTTPQGGVSRRLSPIRIEAPLTTRQIRLAAARTDEFSETGALGVAHS